MTRFLVTGASGLLGLNFSLRAAGEHVVTGVVNRNPVHGAPFGVTAADLTAPGTLERVLEEFRPEVVMHCAAMALLDECEANPDQTWRVNVELPARLATESRRRGIRLVYISTDSVFDGLKGDYREEDAPNPISVYARSKRAGEEGVQAADPDALVARTNFYGWSLHGRRSLAEFFYNNLAAGRSVNGFTDVLFCPLQVNDLADLLLEMVAGGLSGLYHVFSAECLSKYDFGVRVARAFGLDENLIHPASMRDSGLLAARSPNLTMRTEKLAATLGHALPDQAAGLRRFAAEKLAAYPEQVRAMFGQTA
jgi:dTDP-4-dehydrorhamnose reductase